MTTGILTMKVENEFLQEIDKNIKNNMFLNRNEFIKNAIREKTEKTALTEAIKHLTYMRGKAPRHISDEERERVRQKVFEEFEKGIR
jgi:metal-responsive CopG/Arc/MetJ family transcriptional regulator